MSAGGAGSAAPKVWASDVLRAVFADAYTTEAAYMRWRVSAAGAVSYRSVLHRLWTLLFHGKLSMTVMRTSVYTHVHDGFEINVQDMSTRARRMLLTVLEQGIHSHGDYTCASESFVQKAVFLNFAAKPNGDETWRRDRSKRRCDCCSKCSAGCTP